jgi:hypothetical protein
MAPNDGSGRSTIGVHGRGDTSGCPLGHGSDRIIRKVGVDLRCSRLLMPENLPNHKKRVPICDSKGREGMTKIVEPQSWKLCSVPYPLPVLLQACVMAAAFCGR